MDPTSSRLGLYQVLSAQVLKCVCVWVGVEGWRDGCPRRSL